MPTPPKQKGASCVNSVIRFLLLGFVFTHRVTGDNVDDGNDQGDDEAPNANIHFILLGAKIANTHSNLTQCRLS